MYSAGDNAVLPALGFPIRESAGQWLFSASPRLIAAVHALHRLLVPRHPPCALPILTVIRHSSDPKVLEAPGDTRWLAANRRDRLPVGMVVQFSRSAKGASPGLGDRSLKTQQHAPTGYASRSSGRVAWPADSVRESYGRQVRSTYLEPALSSGDAVCAAGRTGAPILELPRKEVIQPHLPVRLPCYDFTPVTSPTFDGSLPKG